jgi:hypothetical protein
MMVRNFNHGKFFGPSGTYTGYTLIICGLIALYSSSSPTSLFLIVPGMFMAFTFSGTILDTEKKRVKTYISVFGAYNAGKWADLSQFTRFNILKVTGNYSLYSRASVRFNMNVSDIRLQLLNHEGNRKIVINKFKNFEDAQKLKDELSKVIFAEKSEL